MTPSISPLPLAGEGQGEGGWSRRRLLKLSGVGGAVVLGGVWLYRTLWRLGPPAPGLQCLTASEFTTASAVGEAFFPGPPDVPFSAAEVKLTEFVDGFVGGQYEDNQRLFKVLLRALETWPLPTHGRGFSQLPLGERQAVLAAFHDSRLVIRQAAYMSMRYMFSLGYFEDLRVRKAAGLRFGCDLSSRFPELYEDGGA